MTTMLERAARAAFDAYWKREGGSDDGKEYWWDCSRDSFIEDARVVLMAVRDANVKPDTYVTRFKFDSDGVEDNYCLDPDEVEDVFPHMIDAILAGES